MFKILLIRKNAVILSLVTTFIICSVSTLGTAIDGANNPITNNDLYRSTVYKRNSEVLQSYRDLLNNEDLSYEDIMAYFEENQDVLNGRLSTSLFKDLDTYIKNNFGNEFYDYFKEIFPISLEYLEFDNLNHKEFFNAINKMKLLRKMILDIQKLHQM